MRYRDPFRVFPKTLESGRTIYYYTTYDHLGRRRQYSTGKLRKSDARRYCQNLFKAGDMTRRKEQKFSAYTRDWYDYEKCPYIQSQLMRGCTYSHSIADLKRARLKKWIMPYFGNILLKEIKTEHIEQWLLQLKSKGMTHNFINHALGDIRVIFNEAYRKNDITFNPVKSVKPLLDNARKKGILTNDEVKRLFAGENRQKCWPQNAHYVFNRTAAETGMRIGEIQALKIENVHEDHIVVRHSWDRKYGLKGTKSNRERIVPVQKELYDQIKNLYKAQGNTGPFIFSENKGFQPVDHKAVYKWYYQALESVGIGRDSRKERNITFHSWRHYVNTRLGVRGVPESVIQAVIGHSDRKMTRHCTAFSLDDLKVIL